MNLLLVVASVENRSIRSLEEERTSALTPAVGLLFISDPREVKKCPAGTVQSSFPYITQEQDGLLVCNCHHLRT